MAQAAAPDKPLREWRISIAREGPLPPVGRGIRQGGTIDKAMEEFRLEPARRSRVDR